MKKITIDFTLEETNKILAALGQLPFAQVHELIQNIQVEAQRQLEASQAEVSSKEEVPQAQGS